MKKLLLSVVFAIFALGISSAQDPQSNLSENAEYQYKTRYKATLELVSDFVGVSCHYISEIVSIWYDAIEANANNRQYVYHGKKCKDFNEALSLYFDERSESDSFNSYKDAAFMLKERIKSHNQYPASLKYAFEGLLELGVMVDELYTCVVAPTGSYRSYNDSADALYLSIKRKLYELEMRYTN